MAELRKRRSALDTSDALQRSASDTRASRDGGVHAAARARRRADAARESLDREIRELRQLQLEDAAKLQTLRASLDDHKERKLKSMADWVER